MIASINRVRMLRFGARPRLTARVRPGIRKNHRYRDDIEADSHPFLSLSQAARLDTNSEPIPPRCVDNPPQRVVEQIVVELARNAERLGQVEVTNPQHIHSWCRGDGLEIL